MLDIREIAEEIVAREGGFVDDPDDPGGATQYGVTLGTLRRLGRDLTGDGRIDRDDVRRVTQGLARDIYLAEYFERPGLGRLPPPLWATVFDMQVNAGAQAVRILQRLLRRMCEQVAVDGQMGPQTAGAAHRALRAAPDHLVDAYGIARRNYYYALGDARPPLRKFARARNGAKGGWIRRAESFIAPKYHLSAAAHAQRVRAWA